MIKTSLLIFPTSPFNFDATFYKPDHFTTGDNFWQPGTRWQTWNHKGIPLGLKIKDKARLPARQGSKIQIDIYAKDEFDARSLMEEIKYRYNLNLDLKPFYKLFSEEKILQPAIKNLYGMRSGHPSSLYEYLIIGVVLQNASVRRSITMFRTLLENYGTELEFDGKKLWCFWEPGRLKNVSEQELRDLKIGYRAKYIKHIDDQFSKGLINEEDLRKRDLETQREELLKLYGVGPATVWYLLFDVFHNWDFFNHVSPWEQKIYSKIFFDRDTQNPVPVAKILKYFERFGKYKQLAVHYVWEDLWWRHKQNPIPWLAKEIRI